MDFSNWKLTLPTNAKGELSAAGDAMEVKQLAGYSAAPYYVPGPDGITFVCPVNGARSSLNTTYPRCELREMAKATEAAWKIMEGYHNLRASRVRVNEMPTRDSGDPARIVIGQIHGPDDEPCRLYYEEVRGLYLHSDKSGLKQDEQEYPLKATDGTIARPKLGEKFDYDITTRDRKLIVSAWVGGKLCSVEDPLVTFWAGKACYFKVGVYLGVGVTKADTKGKGQGGVTIGDVVVSHSAIVPAPAPTPLPAPAPTSAPAPKVAKTLITVFSDGSIETRPAA